MPRFQKLSDARTAFVNDGRVVKINGHETKYDLQFFLEFSIFSSFHPLKTAVQAVESLCLLIFLARERFLIF